ncbi:MAG: DUF1015 family protein [Gammaproteobacteria bacterium]|nr:DUF1015 family protein [Gammaproteobacteria bacterium]
MNLIQPFRGLRPAPDLAAKVASHPYDVLNREEAYKLANNNPLSFLHINKPEVDVDVMVSVYDQQVYDKGRENLDHFISQGILKRDNANRFYVYSQKMGEHSQVGFVGVASLTAYRQGLIKKHEFTRPDKEDDRVNHMQALAAHVGPVFLTYKTNPHIDTLVAGITSSEPEYDFTAEDGTHHTFWVVTDEGDIQSLSSAFNQLDCLYVADGHHRSAAASRVQTMYAEKNPDHNGTESYNWFLAVLFPHDQVQILDYNRIIKDLNGMSSEEFLANLAINFDVQLVENWSAAKPVAHRQFGLCLSGGKGNAARWYKLQVNSDFLNSIDENDPVQNLDVSIMQQSMLTPLLGIEDQRTDKRIDFVGGIRGLQALEQCVETSNWQAAIALYPTSIESLMAIADANEVMPPKSTWFEPKLKSGLVIHMLD